MKCLVRNAWPATTHRAAFVSAALTACTFISGAHDATAQPSVSASPSSRSSTSGSPVVLRFDAMVGEQPFSCSQSYADIGVTKSTVRLRDFRVYVSRVRLIGRDGAETPLTLDQDGLWQHQDVALLDFEDASGACANGGTPDLRREITGRAPAGDYVGVAFDLGLPFEKNHADATSAPSPLNLSRLFWSWNGGYKFARIDLTSTGQAQGWMFHLGSTDCTPNGPPHAPAQSCAFVNRPEIVLKTFSPASDTIAFDLRALFAGSNVDVNQPKTASGCMSSQSDPECGPIFAALGLTFGSTPTPAQSVFRVRTSASAANVQ
jgi:uncharacterized repeat protein (TIGR04052 family)